MSRRPNWHKKRKIVWKINEAIRELFKSQGDVFRNRLNRASRHLNHAKHDINKALRLIHKKKKCRNIR